LTDRLIDSVIKNYVSTTLTVSRLQVRQASDGLDMLIIHDCPLLYLIIDVPTPDNEREQRILSVVRPLACKTIRCSPGVSFC